MNSRDKDYKFTDRRRLKFSTPFRQGARNLLVLAVGLAIWAALAWYKWAIVGFG